jgi:DNA-binding CsgD family transcriptional regulator/tetratricopeptide (TPR) repeat protein
VACGPGGDAVGEVAVAKVQMVGRSAELRVLADQLDAVARGSGRVALISGETGVGKSFLARTLLGQAEDRGFVTLRGQAHQLHEGLVYAPIVEALGPHVAGEDGQPNAWLVGLPGADELGQLFPGVSGRPGRTPADPEVGRVRLFEAVSGLLERMSRRSPMAIWLDNLEWADRGTVELAHYLCLAAADRRLLMLLTWPGRGPEGPLRDLVRSLRRVDRCVEVHLDPLSAVEVTELLRELLSGDPPRELLEAVIPRAGGIPLFVGALVAQLVSSGRLNRLATGWTVTGESFPVLPSIVRDVVVARLAQLGTGERRLFEFVSVAGTAATVEVLSIVLGVDWDAPLRALLANGLLVERRVGRSMGYEVAHPLYAEVAYGELSGLERRRAHARVASALDSVRSADVVVLAPHVRGAGDLIEPHRVLLVLAAAGERALGVHATAEAADYLGDAVGLAHELGRADLLPGLLDLLGSAYEQSGDLFRAAQAWEEALGTATLVDPSRTARLHNRLALLEWERGNLEVVESHLQYVESVPADTHDLVGQHLVRLIVIGRSGDRDVAMAAAERVESLARRYPSSSAEAAAALSRSLVAVFRGDYALSRLEGERALELLDSSDPVYEFGGPHRQISLAALAVGDLDAAIIHAERAIRAAHEHAIPSVECSLRVNLGVTRFLTADWDPAQSELDAAVALGRRSMSTRALAVALVWRGFLHAHRGAVEAGRRCLLEAERLYPPGADQHYSGDYFVVRATIDRMADRPVRALPIEPPLSGARFPVALPLLGEARLASGDRVGVLSVVEQLRDVTGGPPLPMAFADRLEGLLNGDESMLRRAQRVFEELGIAFEAARVALERCELLFDADEAAAALRVFDRIRAKPWSDRARRLLRTHGVRVAPTGRFDGMLSPREEDVARLAADGLSNAQIAARLYLSVRTVETHLRKVYARLGVGSRVELARWVAENSHA